MKDAIVGRLIDEAPRFEAAWRRQVRRQIYLPLALGFLVLVALVAGLIWGGEGKARLWADLALLYLTAAAGAVGLIFLAVIAGMAYGMTWLIARIPAPAGRVRRIATTTRVQARRGADALAAPAVRAAALWASIRAIPGALRSGLRGR